MHAVKHSVASSSYSSHSPIRLTPNSAYAMHDQAQKFLSTCYDKFMKHSVNYVVVSLEIDSYPEGPS